MRVDDPSVEAKKAERTRGTTCNPMMLLLHHSFTNTKMMHILHSAPCFSSSHLSSHDLLIKFILSNITNIPDSNSLMVHFESGL